MCIFLYYEESINEHVMEEMNDEEIRRLSSEMFGDKRSKVTEH